MGSTIESHSSYLNNKRLQIILAKIDDTGSLAKRTKHLHHIEQYYNEVEQLYINIASVLVESILKDINKIRAGYEKVKHLIETDEQYRTIRSLEFLLRCAREFNIKVVGGLQNMEYFFRVGSRQKKGLKNITFFDNSIFGEKNNEDIKES